MAKRFSSVRVRLTYRTRILSVTWRVSTSSSQRMTLSKVSMNSSIHEMASASKDQAVSHMRALLRDAGDRTDNTAELSDFDRVRERIEATTQLSSPPWQQALAAAKTAREEWALGPGPVSTRKLSELLAVRNWNEWKPNSIDGKLSAGLRDRDRPSRLRISLSGTHPQSRRFALSRLVADHLVSPVEESLLPVTTAKTGRQKFQRAFAQGLLCPLEDLMEFSWYARAVRGGP